MIFCENDRAYLWNIQTLFSVFYTSHLIRFFRFSPVLKINKSQGCCMVWKFRFTTERYCSEPLRGGIITFFLAKFSIVAWILSTGIYVWPTIRKFKWILIKNLAFNKKWWIIKIKYWFLIYPVQSSQYIMRFSMPLASRSVKYRNKASKFHLPPFYLQSHSKGSKNCLKFYTHTL